MAGQSSSSSTSTAPSALPSRLLHLSTLLLLSRSSSSSGASTSAALPLHSSASSTGFTHARTLPLHTLAHLLQSYLALLATHAAAAANQAGRTQVAVWDLADALGELGFAGRAGIDELKEEARRGDEGVEEEAEQLRDLAKGLHDHLAPHPPFAPPLAQLTYNPLHPSEVHLLDLAASLPAESAPTPSASSTLSSSSDDDEGDELASPPPAAPAAAAGAEGPEVAIKQEPGAPAAAAADPFGAFDPSFSGDLSSLGLGGGGATSAADAAFLDSLGLSSAPGAATEGAGVGDLAVSLFQPLFQPLDFAGRPIPGFDLLGPVGAPGVGVGDLGFATLSAEEEEEDLRPFPAWRTDAPIPSFVPSFLPPFPGMEQESSASLARRRRRERERAEAIQREREAAAASGTIGRAAAALMLGGGAAGDPWEEVIPYSASSLSTMALEFPNTLPTPSSPHRSGKGREVVNGREGDKDGEDGVDGEGKKRGSKKRRRSLSPPPAGPAESKPLVATAGGADGKASTPAPPPPPKRNTTSLLSFSTIQPLIPHAPSLLRPSQLRRTAASHISHHSRHPELLISSDSLFGSLPYAQPLRQATLPPGFLPDYAPPAIHPFNTNLPWTVSAPVPYLPSSSSSFLPAPPPNPRVPAPLSQIARELAFPLQFDPRPSHRDQLHPNIPLFARLRRIGPPGPLGAKGEALNYEYVGNTALVGLSGVEWPERRWDAKLPRRLGDEEDGAGGGGGLGGGAGGGIKLKLGGGGSRADGRQTREGSLAVGTPWGGAGGGVGSPFASNANATPGPSGLGGSGVYSSTTPAPFPSSSTFDFSSLPPSSAAPVPGPEATPQPDFDYPDFLLSAVDGGGLVGLPALTASLDAAGVAGFDWSGLGLDGTGAAAAAADGAPVAGVTSVGGEGAGAGGEVGKAVEAGGIEVDPQPVAAAEAAPAAVALDPALGGAAPPAPVAEGGEGGAGAAPDGMALDQQQPGA